MKKSASIYLALLGIFLTSWIGLVLIPYVQAGRLAPEVDLDTKETAPPPISGLVEQGRAVYAANGCVYCHSQQVRSRSGGADIDRGDGARRTVARDYIRDHAAYLGNSRLGPDLSNEGVRRDGKADWLFQHLYSPESVTPGTNCPPLPFLFSQQKITGQPASDALDPKAISDAMPTVGNEVIPGHDARALVAYLLSLKRSSYKLPEAPEEAAAE